MEPKSKEIIYAKVKLSSKHRVAEKKFQNFKAALPKKIPLTCLHFKQTQ